MKKEIISYKFDDKNIRTLMIAGEPWFVARDVGDALGIADVRTTIRDFPKSEQGRHTMPTLGGAQEMSILNEPGVYRLVFQSRKPEAERFKTWVFEKVLPQIRKTGGYGSGTAIDAGLAREVNSILERSGRTLRLMYEENRHLRREVKLFEDIARLEKGLRKKGTAVTGEEKETIKRMAVCNTADDIAYALNRTASTIRRILREGGKA